MQINRDTGYTLVIEDWEVSYLRRVLLAPEIMVDGLVAGTLPVAQAQALLTQFMAEVPLKVISYREGYVHGHLDGVTP